jgi:hypothetical protein
MMFVLLVPFAASAITQSTDASCLLNAHCRIPIFIEARRHVSDDKGSCANHGCSVLWSKCKLQHCTLANVRTPEQFGMKYQPTMLKPFNLQY